MIRQIWDFHWNFTKKKITLISLFILSTFLFHEKVFIFFREKLVHGIQNMDCRELQNYTL